MRGCGSCSASSVSRPWACWHIASRTESTATANFFEALLSGYARAAYVPISLIDGSAVLAGTEIHGQYAIRIVKGCDAMEAKILFVSAILAFPGEWLRKSLAACLGVLALAGVNLIRIASLYYVGMASPNWVELLHLEVWPLVLILLAAGLFLLFVQRSTSTVAKA
jgi:exosortase/archaeosortase family protein